MTVVGVVGLGSMGSAIARRLMACGHDVVAWNRTPAAVKELGARGASTPADAAAESEAVITMVADPDALRAVTEGPVGVAAGVGADTTLIQMSTVSPEAIERLAGMVEHLLDAPVLGPGRAAEDGSLEVLLGGEPALVERWTPLLSTLGTCHPLGGLGAATAGKLVANGIAFGVLGVLGEGLALAERLGLDREAAFELLGATPLAAEADKRRAAIESGDFGPRFALSLATKDARLTRDAAPAADTPVLEAARRWLEQAEEAGAGGSDYTAVLAHILGSASGSG